MTGKDEVYEADVVVTNPQGIHLRVAAILVRAAAKFPNADFVIKKDDYEVNGKSIMGVLTLVAEQGTPLKLRARGPQGNDLINTMIELFEAGFDEELA